MKTYTNKLSDIKRERHVIDAKDQVLGRLATRIARLLMGKNKATFARNVDMADLVVVINAAQVRVTGNKMDQKMYYHHSHYPGGLSETNYRRMSQKFPTRAMELAIKGMLPHNRLGRKLATHFRVYADAEHNHESQNPQPYEMK